MCIIEYNSWHAIQIRGGLFLEYKCTLLWSIQYDQKEYVNQSVVLLKNAKNTIARVCNKQKSSKKNRKYKETIINDEKETFEILETHEVNSLEYLTLAWYIEGKRSSRKQLLRNLISLSK